MCLDCISAVVPLVTQAISNRQLAALLLAGFLSRNAHAKR
jgi:hypothetical protein